MRGRRGTTLAGLATAVLVMAGLATPIAAAQDTGGPNDLLISEYVEGSSNNKALEFYNGTGAEVALGDYVLSGYHNGNTTTSYNITLQGTLADGETYVLAHSSAVPEILDVADQTSGAGLWNGDDALVLRNGDVVVDSFGQVGVDPGDSWGTPSTMDNTLRRHADVCTGDTNPDDGFDPAAEWTGVGTDVFDGLGSHSIDCTGGGGGDGDAADLLLSEAVVTPTAGEFVEIHNAGDTTIELTDVYLTDATFAGGDTYYYNIVTGANAGGGGFSDFHARFPEGASISPGAYQTIAMNGADFAATYGVDADYELFDTTSAAADMREALPGSINDQGGLTNSGEVVVLYSWDGVSDLVADIDYLLWGDKDEAVDKTGVAVDGPDADTEATAYLADTAIVDQDVVATGAHASDSSWQRADLAEGDEAQAGGNGVAGSDETSENLSATWCETTPTPGAASACDTGGDGGECGDPAMLIGAVQGDGMTSPEVGNTVEIEGIVVGDFQEGGFDGYYVQDAGDDDPDTSDGIFVFDEDTDVASGDRVHVTGMVSEFFGMTEITPDAVEVCSSGNDLPDATAVSLPVDDVDDLERFEGMYVTLPQDLAIIEYFNYDRFGEIVLGTERQYQPTAVHEPDSAEAAALADLNRRSRITLDDGRSFQNPDPAIHPNGDEFTLDNRFRGGDLVTNATGVLDYRFNLYRIQPTQGADFTVANPRPDVPEVEGRLQVASLNVLNYFTTIDTGAEICGPSGDLECRGADTELEFERQEAKIVAALAAMDADVVGLMEIENSPTAVETLVAALNDEVGAGTYAAISTGTIGTDAIKVGLIHKTDSVDPKGEYAILDSSVDPRFDDEKNRPVLAQTFVEHGTGADVTVAVNHLKSKGSSCGPGDDDPVQGNCNLTRTLAAEALVDWLDANPTKVHAEEALVIGDLNAYDKEDPIDALVDGGYTDLLHDFQREFAYTYVFDGQLGYLDYGLANEALADQVTGAAAWHANTDEPDLIDYDMSFKRDAQDALYAPGPYRASDHDAVIVGLDLDRPGKRTGQRR